MEDVVNGEGKRWECDGCDYIAATCNEAGKKARLRRLSMHLNSAVRKVDNPELNDASFSVKGTFRR